MMWNPNTRELTEGVEIRREIRSLQVDQRLLLADRFVGVTQTSPYQL